MQLVTVYDPRDVAAACAEHPGEELILSRLPERLLLERARQVEVGVLDFDGLMTTGKNHWQRLQELLPPELSQDEDRDRAWYFSGEDSFSCPDPLPNEWWLGADADVYDRSAIEAAYSTRSIFRYREAGLTAVDLWKVGASIVPRDGTEALFARFPSGQRHVVSFGIEQVILACLEAHNLEALVYATRLVFGPGGRIRSTHPKVMSGPMKGPVVREIMKRHGLRDAEVFAAGDSISDIEMMPEGGLNFLFMPSDDAYKRLADARLRSLGVMWKKLVCVVVGNSLAPVAELLG